MACNDYLIGAGLMTQTSFSTSRVARRCDVSHSIAVEPVISPRDALSLGCNYPATPEGDSARAQSTSAGLARFGADGSYRRAGPASQRCRGPVGTLHELRVQ